MRDPYQYEHNILGKKSGLISGLLLVLKKKYFTTCCFALQQEWAKKENMYIFMTTGLSHRIKCFNVGNWAFGFKQKCTEISYENYKVFTGLT